MVPERVIAPDEKEIPTAKIKNLTMGLTGGVDHDSVRIIETAKQYAAEQKAMMKK